MPAAHSEHAVALASDHDSPVHASHTKLCPSASSLFHVPDVQPHPAIPVPPGDVEPDGHGTQSCVPPIE